MGDARRIDHEWHCAINRFSEGKAGKGDWPRFMYEAKKMWGEMPRMILLHRQERLSELPKIHQQCSHSAPVPLPENALTCCKGIKCRQCPELLALEKADMPPETIDEAKAWTCAAHIVSTGGDVMNEGYLLTTGDLMFWDNVHASLAHDGDSPR